MGNYNPHAPQILGEEWVPIRNENFELSPVTNSLEAGHSFTLANSRTLQDCRTYINDPAAARTDQVFLFNIYNKGLEAATGPIRSVLIPVNNGGITGTGSSLQGALTVAAALESPDDTAAIIYTPSFSAVRSWNTELFFAVNSYPELFNKRILGVNFRYVCILDPGVVAPVHDGGSVDSLVQIFGSSGQISYQQLSTHQGFVGGSFQNSTPEYGTIRLGEINPLWDTSLSAYTASSEQLPWTYAGLQRFEASASNRLSIYLTIQLDGTEVSSFIAGQLSYAALEVFFCEENRLAVGGVQRGSFTAGELVRGQGVMVAPARTIGTYTRNPVLTAGDYSVVLSSADIGDRFPSGPMPEFPKLNALREYYPIPPHPGVQVNIPAPVDSSKVGLTFSKETVHVLPQLSLHTSGGPLTEVHVYGRQAIAQVYGTITATQEILDSAAGSARTWPQVRYYARRFGDTTVPLLLSSPTITGTGMSVQISPPDFDALPEIIDGWKEVTLRFDTAPTMGAGTNPQWRWSANGETPGDRWEVLGCMAPALSGLPGNLLNPVASPHQLSTATYGAPNSGSTINFGWIPQYAPGVTATSDDQTSDGVLIFAQDMPAVTGFSVTMTSQPVSGIGLNCGLDPCCIPTAIRYNSLAWSGPINTGRGSDEFDRVVAAGSWGSADVGGAYTLSGTAADFSVGTALSPWDTTDKGLITFSAVNSARFAVLNVGAIDFDVTVDVALLSTPDGGGLLRGGPTGRYTDGNNNYYASVDVSSTGVVQLRLEKRVGGVITILGLTSRPDLSGGIGAELRVRIVGYGTFLKAKVWDPLLDEPAMWDIEVNDTDLTTGNFAGVFGRDGSTSTGHTVGYSNLVITAPSYWFGYYELQRMDDLTDWQTIMKATSVATVGFSDYEARVGLVSSYRIRAVDTLGFAGPWSSTVTGTITEPGIVIDCEGGHILIFTSNSRQDGSINLAYSTIWEGNATVAEDFEFPETGDVQLQKMYNKNFVTAFRPLERGGERFTRAVLVQAAAISAPTLADFTALRDMAWDTVPYICVRDEDGNRWFATVLVPSGRVQLNRTIYMAPVTVVEVTDTAFPVDP